MRIAHVFIVIVAIAVVELYLLIAIGGEIGALATIALVFITAALGLWMLRQQGLATLRRALLSAQRGDRPLLEVAEAPFLLLGGLLLLIPGFFTDLLGFLCLLPFTRRWLLSRVVKKAQSRGQIHTVDRGRQTPRVIEGEWRREGDDR